AVAELGAGLPPVEVEQQVATRLRVHALDGRDVAEAPEQGGTSGLGVHLDDRMGLGRLGFVGAADAHGPHGAALGVAVDAAASVGDPSRVEGDPDLDTAQYIGLEL